MCECEGEVDMIFDVMLLLKEKNVAGKERRSAYRIHDRDLSRFLRDAQDRGDYIEQVHPLFRQKIQEESEYSKAGLSREKMREVREQIDETHFGMSHIVDSIDPDTMIDSHGF
jgi:hypothetical protein